ncbi:uncharacterized protein G2W53_040142 [Senna tora]|uniref:Uncharacterized protein n=1 Tax=Senna tora TaxID=362788 RepID=A0A834W6U4_9FABA|nr:uncharacterized protein G2W53_040142 [Senna tora]
MPPQYFRGKRDWQWRNNQVHLA